MSDTYTPNLGLTKPPVGASDDTWGEKLNGNFDILDAAVSANSVPSITISDTPPLSPVAGQLWFESDTGATYIWYDDGTSAQWVYLSDTTVGGGGGGVPSDVNPVMDGVAAPGVAVEYSRGDHVHPSDTSKASVAYVDAGDAALTSSVNNKVAKTGDTMTGNLAISKSNPVFSLTKTVAASDIDIQTYTGNSPRWTLRLGSSEVESGGNAGSNFDLYAWVDDGSSFRKALSINRASGVLTVPTGDGVLSAGIGGPGGFPRVKLYGDMGAGVGARVDFNTGNGGSITTEAGSGGAIRIAPGDGVLGKVIFNFDGTTNFTNANAATANNAASVVLAGGLGIAKTIHASSKGHLFGNAGGANGANNPQAMTDSNIILYNAGPDNWAGIGTDGSGNIWFRTGNSGTPPPRLYIGASGQTVFLETSPATAYNAAPIITLGGLGIASNIIANGNITTNSVLQANNVGVQTTTTELFQIGSNGVYISSFHNTINVGKNSNADGNDLWINYSGYATGSTRFRTFNVGNGKAVSICAFVGSTGIISGDFNDTSDVRLKKDVKSLSSGLALINALTPVSFTWADKAHGGRKSLGFVAQDVAKIIPELVNKIPATELAPDETYTLKYTGLIAPLVKAVQEISDRLIALEAQVGR